MKDQNFSIKISDLLNQTGSVDEVKFEKKFSVQIPHLTKEGVSGTFVIQTLNEAALLGTLTDVACAIQDVCDSCEASYPREVLVPEYTARFVIKDERTEEEKEANSEEEMFLIDAKSETINIEDMVIQSILLHEPIVKRCPACAKKIEEQAGDDDELPTFESRGTIHFYK